MYCDVTFDIVQFMSQMSISHRLKYIVTDMVSYIVQWRQNIQLKLALMSPRLKGIFIAAQNTEIAACVFFLAGNYGGLVHYLQISMLVSLSHIYTCILLSL